MKWICFYTARPSHVCMLALSVLLAATFCTKAFSGEKEEAKQFFDEGTSLFAESQYQAAAERFTSSLALFPTYNGYFNLANCYRAMRQSVRALDVLEQMRSTLGPPESKETRQKFDRFEQEIRDILGELTIETVPEDAVVGIDDTNLRTGPFPKPFLLEEGYHKVTVQKEGFIPVEKSVRVRAKAAASIAITMAPAPAALRISVEQDGAVVWVDGKRVGTSPLSLPVPISGGAHQVEITKTGFISQKREINTVPDQETALSFQLVPETKPAPLPPVSNRRISPLFWSAASVTVAVGATAFAFTGLAAAKEDEFQTNNDAYKTASQDADVDAYDAARLAAREDGMRYSHLALGFGIGAAVLAVGTAAILVMDLKRESPQSNSKVLLSAVPGGLRLVF